MTASKALVFDIKRFAVHDGDGIRTTIFFKGCPLRCKWCQNPEGLSTKRQLLYFKNNCIHCGSCARAAKGKELSYANGRPYLQRNYPGKLDHLVNACPAAALRYDSEEYGIEELLSRICEDKVFFQEEGGVTFSGGEPLLQGEFLKELLPRCRQEGIHTAVETTMYAPLSLVKKLLPWLDQIYIDIKVFDEKRHEELTGVSNALIKSNIRYVLESDARDKVIMRTPLIPKLTAEKQNLTAIAAFLSSIYPNVRYELLNYNPLAPAKYELVGLSYGIKEACRPLTKEELEACYELVYQQGITHIIKE